MRKSLTAAGIGVALAGAAPALAQHSAAGPAQEPMRIGIIDVRANQLSFSDRNTAIHYRELPGEGRMSASWTSESGLDHGEMVASAFVRQARQLDPDRPIEVYAVNPMYENSSPADSALYNRNSPQGSSRTISLNMDGARQALAWFRQNNVKVVVTAMVGGDTPVMRSFMQEAERQGMIVFAAAGNKPSAGRVFPAAYPEAISIAADNRDMSLRNNSEVGSWINFAMNGSAPRGPRTGGEELDVRSSFAAAKAAAFGSYAVATGQVRDRQGMLSYLQGLAEERSYQVRGQDVTVAFLDERNAAIIARENPECAAEKHQLAEEQRQSSSRAAMQAAASGLTR